MASLNGDEMDEEIDKLTITKSGTGFCLVGWHGHAQVFKKNLDYQDVQCLHSSLTVNLDTLSLTEYGSISSLVSDA
jgi:hypothetical protein